MATKGIDIGLTGYSAIRNLGLVVAQVLGFDAVVFLDDDEVIDDEEFLEKAMYGLGKLTKKGIPILAKSGFYFNDEGTYYSKSQNRWYNHFWQQGRAFNNWITKAMAVSASFAFEPCVWWLLGASSRNVSSFKF